MDTCRVSRSILSGRMRVLYIYRNKNKTGEKAAGGEREGEEEGGGGKRERGEEGEGDYGSAESCIGDNGNKSSACVNFIMERKR